LIVQATPEMLAALEPGELTVKVVREGWQLPPDHVAIARSNQALRNFAATPGSYRGGVPNEAQIDCLEGA
jgi:hypothetical protein